MIEYYDAIFKEFCQKGIVIRDVDTFFEGMFTADGILTADETAHISANYLPRHMRYISFGKDSTIIFSANEPEISDLLDVNEYRKVSSFECSKESKKAKFARIQPNLDLHLRLFFLSQRHSNIGPNQAFTELRMHESRAIGEFVYIVDNPKKENRILLFNSYQHS